MTQTAHRGPPYDRLFFDCDSTLCTIEGLDCLAERAGLAEQLRPITIAAMNGDVDFAAAYAERLALLKPDQPAVEWLAEQYLNNVTPGMTELVRSLQQAGKQVHIVSGGILQAMLLLSAPLGIPVSHIHAVSLLLDSDGSYQGYDGESPLCRQHGKAALCRQLVGDGERAAFIGDGITDLEAAAAGIDFIGYGGIIRRPAVANAAAVFCHDIANLLAILLSKQELALLDTEPA